MHGCRYNIYPNFNWPKRHEARDIARHSILLRRAYNEAAKLINSVIVWSNNVITHFWIQLSLERGWTVILKFFDAILTWSCDVFCGKVWFYGSTEIALKTPFCSTFYGRTFAIPCMIVLQLSRTVNYFKRAYKFQYHEKYRCILNGRWKTIQVMNIN